MRCYILSFADAIGHTPEHPERTAKRSSASGLNFDVTFQVWPNRASLAKSIRMQQRRASRQDDWRPCAPLGDTEGY